MRILLSTQMRHFQRSAHDQGSEKNCKPTAMMRHRIWVNILSPNNNNQPTSSSQIEERRELFQLANQSVQQPTKETIRPILNKNKTKKTQNSRQGSSQINLRRKNKKPRQRGHIRMMITRDTILTSYHPISSALRYTLLWSNIRPKPGD